MRVAWSFVLSALLLFPGAALLKLRINRNISSADAQVNETVDFEPVAANGQPTANGTPPPNGNGADPALSTVDIKSTPDGAEITVDEKFMGSTPSSLRLPVGE